MNALTDIYRSSLALLTDLYEMTMEYGYWKTKTDDKEAVFNLFFREHPFREHPFWGGFTIACGLQCLVDFVSGFRFDDGDLAQLSRDARKILDEAGLSGRLWQRMHSDVSRDISSITRGDQYEKQEHR